MPDSVFVEDIAVVFDELAIITRPGAESRRQETPAVAEALAAYRPLHVIQPPGTVDGGDVLVAGRRVFVGRSSRTNEAAVGQMRQVLEPLGYTVSETVVRGCLHLKSAVTALGDDLLLVNPGVDRSGARSTGSRSSRSIRRSRRRPTRCGFDDRIVFLVGVSAHRRAASRAAAAAAPVDASEVAKAEGAVTCCSLIVASLIAAMSAGRERRMKTHLGWRPRQREMSTIGVARLPPGSRRARVGQGCRRRRWSVISPRA